MPPKPKFTREEVISAALNLVSERGFDALTSRELGAALGSSARPIFTLFTGMDEVCEAVREAALAVFNSYADRAKDYTPVFKQIGLQMIMFAAEQPKLYQLLYMSESTHANTFEDLFGRLGDVAQLSIDAIKVDYGLNEDDAMQLFKHCWISTYGLGALIATKACRFTEQEVSAMLSHEFVAMLTLIKSGKAGAPPTIPQKK